MDNFKRPYHAKSIAEFWKRWHISLSTWFKDYVYIPLGGNRVGMSRWYVNLFIVFLVSGLWHGANWTFVIWGALHGVYLIVGIVTFESRNRIAKKLKLNLYPNVRKVIQVLTTFCLVCFSWIFFRANDVSEAAGMIRNIFSGWQGLFSIDNIGRNIFLGQGAKAFVVAIALIVFMESIHMIQRHGSIRHMLDKRPAYIRFAIYIILILGIIFLGQFQNTEFIYFQF